MKKRVVVCIVSFLSCILLNAQVVRTCESRVVDANTGESLPMAAVRSSGGASTVANADGYFKLSAQSADSLTVSYVGYRSQTLPVAGLSDVVRLVPGNVVIGNVDVSPLGKRWMAWLRRLWSAWRPTPMRQATSFTGRRRGWMAT